jgi:hypothetical protein
VVNCLYSTTFPATTAVPVVGSIGTVVRVIVIFSPPPTPPPPTSKIVQVSGEADVRVTTTDPCLFIVFNNTPELFFNSGS